jgi:hypothetical protein
VAIYDLDLKLVREDREEEYDALDQVCDDQGLYAVVAWHLEDVIEAYRRQGETVGDDFAYTWFYAYGDTVQQAMLEAGRAKILELARNNAEPDAKKEGA